MYLLAKWSPHSYFLVIRGVRGVVDHEFLFKGDEAHLYLVGEDSPTVLAFISCDGGWGLHR